MDVPWIKSNPNRSGSCPIGVLSVFALSLTLIPACLQARSAKAERYFKKALRLSEKGDMDRARVAYDAALTIDPDFAETRVNRGRIHLFNEALEDAGSDLTHALSVSPGDVEALILRSRVFQAQGRLGEAMEDLSASMAGAGGQDPEKLFMRANLLYELKDSDNARLDLEAVAGDRLAGEQGHADRQGLGVGALAGDDGLHAPGNAQVQVPVNLQPRRELL